MSNIEFLGLSVIFSQQYTVIQRMRIKTLRTKGRYLHTQWCIRKAVSGVYFVRRGCSVLLLRLLRSVSCYGKFIVNINALLRHEIQFWYPSRYLHAFVHSFPGSRLSIGILVTPPLFSVQFLRRRLFFIIYFSLFLSISSPVVITWFLHQCIPPIYIPHFQRPLSPYSFPLKKAMSSLSSSPLHFLLLMFFLCFILSVFPSVLCRPNVRLVVSFVYFYFTFVCVAWGIAQLLCCESLAFTQKCSTTMTIERGDFRAELVQPICFVTFISNRRLCICVINAVLFYFSE
jgi:hypothetical protein